MIDFRIDNTCGPARAGVLQTPHGDVPTPVFMPCGTAGTVKGVTPDHLQAAGVRMLLGNTYHLMLRPGADVVAALGGLHAMMAWPGAILTDSGGYQVFSLAHRRTLSEQGVVFQSHIDGSTVELTPERCVDIQLQLAPDVAMQLDVCPPGQAPRDEVARAVELSARWAARCRQRWIEGGGLEPNRPALFGIQQGGVHADLRAESAGRIVELDLPGYAVGGLSVGEGPAAMTGVLEHIDGQFPRHKPRYLMGVGEPRDILAGVLAGIDMFDCVLPTRNGRNAQAFTFAGRLKLRNAAFARDARPLEEGCDCYACRHFSRAALRHYFMAQEMLGPTLVTIHNLRFFARLMGDIRQAIVAGDLPARAGALSEALYPPGNP